MTIPTDTLYGQQWHFGVITNNGTDPSLMERLWDEYSGSGVHVGIYDNGVEYAHSDLNDNYDPTRHVLIDTDGDPLTPPVAHDGNVVGNSGHGTSVAGIIGAEMNGEGTVGIAHGASLTSVNIFDAGSTALVGTAGFFSALHQMTNFDVVNHSWGSTSNTYFTDSRNPNVAGSYRAVILAEFEYAAANGRGGLGTVICQAAGNLNIEAAGDGLNGSRYTLTVGAILETGFVASYSSYGASLLVSSAGGDLFSSLTTNNVSTANGTRLITTTDMVGANGANHVTPDPNSGTPPFTVENADYTNRMNGTSAATPMISGIVALMLEANPDLGWRDVHNIIANTAFHKGSSIGSAPGLNEGSAWLVNKADGWNGGGMHFSNDYGYGNADAFGAVRLAEAMGVMDAVAQTSANEQAITTGTLVSGAVIADFVNNTYTFNVAGNLSIEHAAMTIGLTHSDFTDLRIFLVSAEGTEIQLYDGLAGSDAAADAGITWTFGIEALRGELSAGTWTLKINDVVGGDGGILNDVKLEVFGTAPSNDDTYHFTDEFAQLVVLDPARLILTDSDGGTDWFDGSTLLGAARIDLNDGATSTVDGETITIAAGTFIENAILSDGDDVVVGNELDNRLYGMRGNDTLKGGGGSDVLDGGKGNDLFYVDNAGDTVVEATGGGNDRVAAQAGFALGGGQEIERLTTTNSNAVRSIDLRGNELAQTIVGNNGDNWLHDGGVGGADTLAGRGGNDFYTVYNSGAVIIEGKGQGDFDRVAAGVDYVLAQGVEIESLRTTGQHATYAISLTGNEFSQQIIGNDGDNRIDGKGGSDTIQTGLGSDAIAFSTALAGTIDKIVDFDIAEDQIELDDAIFSVIGLGMLAASSFKDNATGVRDADDHIIYNSNTGSLFYDVDGLGGVAAVKFAWLAAGLSLTAADFMVI